MTDEQKPLSNPDHVGPHCDGLCEGMAYTIEIRGLRSKIAKLEASIESHQATAFFRNQEIVELRAENAELKRLLCIAHDYLIQHWDMDSIPLINIKEAAEKVLAQLPPADHPKE